MAKTVERERMRKKMVDREAKMGRILAIGTEWWYYALNGGVQKLELADVCIYEVNKGLTLYIGQPQYDT